MSEREVGNKNTKVEVVSLALELLKLRRIKFQGGAIPYGQIDTTLAEANRTFDEKVAAVNPTHSCVSPKSA